jgi:hypothetical protein
MERSKLKIIAITSAVALNGLAHAEHELKSANSIEEAFIKQSTHHIQLRYRHEMASDKVRMNQFDGSTAPNGLYMSRLNSLRTQLQYYTGEYQHTSFGLTFTDVSNFFATHKHNPGVPGLSKGQNRYTLISEPRGTALNQLWVQNRLIDKTNIRLGAQFFELDNGRFFGKNDWHQNPQSYQGVVVTNDSFMDTRLTYAYFSRTMRNTSTHHGSTNLNGRNIRYHEASTNVVHIHWSPCEMVKASLYDYRMKDVHSVNGYQYGDTAHYFSANNFGARVTGDVPVENRTVGNLTLNYEIEAAKQRGVEGRPQRYSASYWVAGLGASRDGFGVNVRQEVLNGKAGQADRQFKFIGNNYEFLGRAGVFQLTPQAGIKDTMVRIGYTDEHNAWHVKLDMHSFRPQAKGTRYGSEYDACIGYCFAKHYHVGAAAAKFKARAGNRGSVTFTELKDVTRYWLTLGANF